MAGVHAMMIAGSGDDDILYINGVYLKPNGITIAAKPNAAKGTWHTLGGKFYYVAVDYTDLVSVVSIYKGLTGAGKVLANLTRDGQTKSIPLNQVVTTFVDRLSTDASNSGLFYSAQTFNQSLSSWDVSNVTIMGGVFYACYVFNQDLNAWDTSNVTNMDSLFAVAQAFNQDISGWDTGNVTNMRSMFYYSSVFSQDLSGWCVSKLPSVPPNFHSGTSAAWTAAMKPKWGAPCS